jgi:hypothetical protein
MSGLNKRVRGANAPQATNAADAFRGGRQIQPGTPLSADSVASILSEFTKGVERGLGNDLAGEGNR